MVKMPDSIDVQGGPITLIFSKNGRAFFSERITGNIWEVTENEKYKLIKHFSVVQATGHHEAGLLGIVLDPKFEENNYLYAFYTEGEDLDHAKNKVVRILVDGNEETTILQDIPGGRIHNGGMVVFGKDEKLYVGVGVDNPLKDKSQDKDFLGGKILRINTDGSIPDDNPFQGSPVFSLGHRNIFGIAIHPGSGELYVSDVGPEKDDEINIVTSGMNYGWPKVVGYSNDPRFKDPIITYTPVITPTQSVFVDGALYFGSYNEGTVHKLTFSSDLSKVISDDIVYSGKPFGVVGVFVSPDGDFFVATTNKILKVKLKVARRGMKKNIIIWIIIAIIVVALGAGWYFMYGNSQGKTTNNNDTTVVASNKVEIKNSTFVPSTVTINKGEMVVWENKDSIIHQVTADDNSFDLGYMNDGVSVKRVFASAGTYKYHCALHSYMKGTVIVK